MGKVGRTSLRSANYRERLRNEVPQMVNVTCFGAVCHSFYNFAGYKAQHTRVPEARKALPVSIGTKAGGI
jgi:hypothetical protein